MAYLARDEEEEKQPMTGSGQSPMTAGAQSAPMAKPAGTNAAPQRSAMQGTGSNFVNLQSFLSPTVAGQNQQKVQNLGGQLQGEEKQAFDKAADPLRNASFTPLSGSAREIVDKLVPQQAVSAAPTGAPAVPEGGYYDAATGIVWSAKDPKTGMRTEVKAGPAPQSTQPTGATRVGGGGGAMQFSDRGGAGPSMANSGNTNNATTLAQLQAMLTQDYTGPMTVDYDAASSKGMQRLNQLGNADTAINALAPGNFTENLPSANYGQGNRWLDEALIKGDNGTMGAIGDVKKGADAFTKSSADESAKLGDKAKGLKAQAAEARGKVRGELDKYGKEILSGIDTRVGEANTSEQADQQSGTVRDPTTGATYTVPIGQEAAGWEAGSGANRGNISTGTERGRLSLLSQLLGDPNMAVESTGNYVRGRNTTKSTPGDVAVKPWQGNAATGAQIREATKGMTPDQMTRYQQLRQQGYSTAEASELARSDVPIDIKPVGNLAVKSVKG